MINLLPPEIKDEYRYGLRNSGLLRWITACTLGIVGLGLIASYGLFTLQRSSAHYQNQVTNGQQVLQEENLAGTETQVKTITSNLKLATQVLSKEILFSKLLKQIAVVIPSNTALKDLDISQTTGAIDITADAKDYQTAAQVQVNLSDPKNQIFSKADIIGITCTATPENEKYPCTVQVRALFASNNPFLFTSNKDAQ